MTGSKRIRPMAFVAALLIGAIAGGAASCTSTKLGEAVEVGFTIADGNPERAQQYRRSVEAVTGAVAPISWDNERNLGAGVALQAIQRIGPEVADEALQRYVNLVGRSVARNSSRPNIPWIFSVLDNPTPNAFAGPGGYIFITTGALALMDDEAELAGVLAHEVAHVTEAHLLQMYRRANLFGGIAGAVSVTGRGNEGYAEMVGFGSSTLFDRGLDQRFEFEADLVGAEIAYLTGYDPMGLSRFLEKMDRGGRSGGWMSTHPATSQRLARLRSLVVDQMGSPGGATARERFQREAAARLPR